MKKTMRISLIVLLCFVMMVCPALAHNITDTSVSNTNIDGTSNVNDIAVTGEFDPASSTATDITNDVNVYVTFASITGTPSGTTVNYAITDLKGSTVQLTSIGTIIGSSWDFSGKGSTTEVLTTSFDYSKAGYYTTVLTIDNDFTVITGQVTNDLTTLESYGSIENSRASFSLIILIPLVLAGILLIGIFRNPESISANSVMPIIVMIGIVIITLFLMVVLVGSFEGVVFNT